MEVQIRDKQATYREILELVKMHGEMDKTSIVELSGRSPRTVYRALYDLKAQGFLVERLSLEDTRKRLWRTKT